MYVKCTPLSWWNCFSGKVDVITWCTEHTFCGTVAPVSLNHSHCLSFPCCLVPDYCATAVCVNHEQVVGMLKWFTSMHATSWWYCSSGGGFASLVPYRFSLNIREECWGMKGNEGRMDIHNLWTVDGYGEGRGRGAGSGGGGGGGGGGGSGGGGGGGGGAWGWGTGTTGRTIAAMEKKRLVKTYKQQQHVTFALSFGIDGIRAGYHQFQRQCKCHCW